MNPCDACHQEKNVRIHVYANAEETVIMGICIECWKDMALARLAGKSPQEWYADATSNNAHCEDKHDVSSHRP